MAARGSEDSEEEAEQLQYKVIILGDGATGFGGVFWPEFFG